MYAIVDAYGSQVKVVTGETVKVPYINEPDKKEIELDKVLLLSGDDNVEVGTPYLQDVKVKCTLIKSEKDKKVIVFKMKRRKRQRKKAGHRQLYSLLRVNEIVQ